MIYNGVEFDTQRGSTSVTKSKEQEVISLPYSDQNKEIDRGRPATEISTTIIAYSEDEKNNIEALLHSSQEAELEFGARKYKKVKTGGSFKSVPVTSDKRTAWLIQATFIALDPIPYDLAGDPLYD